jgi:threonine/homoserine/homoserine lactone efflux protein
MILYFLQGAALALPTTLTPSPFKVFIISQALQSGLRRALPAAFAPLITDGPIIALVVLALTQMPQWLLNLLRLGGGFFLLYLAGRLLLVIRTDGPTLRASPQAARHNLFRAVIINLLNPNPYIFWGVVAGPILLQGMEQSLVVGLSFVAGFYVTFVGGLITLIAVFATVGRLNPTVTRILLGLSALGMAWIGINQIITSARILIDT